VTLAITPHHMAWVDTILILQLPSLPLVLGVSHIVSSLETIKGSRVDVTEDDAMEGHTTKGNVMNDVTGDEATDNATVTVDEVLDKCLYNITEAYGSSARDSERSMKQSAACVSPERASIAR